MAADAAAALLVSKDLTTAHVELCSRMAMPCYVCLYCLIKSTMHKTERRTRVFPPSGYMHAMQGSKSYCQLGTFDRNSPEYLFQYGSRGARLILQQSWWRQVASSLVDCSQLNGVC